MYGNLAILALFAFAYSLVAERLARTPVNGAVVYLAFGVIVGPVGLGWLDLGLGSEGIRTIAELTLALVLFTDASNANLGVLRQTVRLPRRLLLVGLPLTILLGVGVGALLFPELGLLQVAILATILAPTDAALGKAVVSNPAVPDPVRQGLNVESVPDPVRQGLNVESGLNDGICVPILFTFLALATQSGAEGSTGALALRLVAEEIGIGAGIGIGLAFAGARGLRAAADRGWVVPGPWARIPVVALAFASFALAQFAGGSGFIACFVGGLVFGALVAPQHKETILERAEGSSEVLALVTWVIFGAAVVAQYGGPTDWRVVLYAVLSLTVVRMRLRRRPRDAHGQQALPGLVRPARARQHRLPGDRGTGESARQRDAHRRHRRHGGAQHRRPRPQRQSAGRGLRGAREGGGRRRRLRLRYTPGFTAVQEHALGDGHDDGGRPAEHQDPVGRLERGEHPPRLVQGDVAVAEGGEGDQ
jgi:NhaP-type Na+/H+ or K+/H+ antiporter